MVDVVDAIDTVHDIRIYISVENIIHEQPLTHLFATVHLLQ